MNPFTMLTNFVNSIFGDLFNLAIAIFAVGILVCSLVVWRGDEQAAEKFKKGLMVSIIGLIVAILIKVIIAYIRANLTTV